MKLDQVENTQHADTEKISKCLSELIQLIGNNNFSVAELLLLYGNLGLQLGGSIEGGNIPSIEELQKMYYSNPSTGVALMLTGLTVTSWFDSYLEQMKKINN